MTQPCAFCQRASVMQLDEDTLMPIPLCVRHAPTSWRWAQLELAVRQLGHDLLQPLMPLIDRVARWVR